MVDKYTVRYASELATWYARVPAAMIWLVTPGTACKAEAEPEVNAVKNSVIEELGRPAFVKAVGTCFEISAESRLVKMDV